MVVFELQRDCDGDGWAPEICDGPDNDCDLEFDEARCSDYEVDDDGGVDGVELAWPARSGCPGPDQCRMVA